MLKFHTAVGRYHITAGAYSGLSERLPSYLLFIRFWIQYTYTSSKIALKKTLYKTKNELCIHEVTLVMDFEENLIY